jgi:hypothetical protein
MPLQVWVPDWIGQRTFNQLLILGLAVFAPVGLLPRACRRFALPIMAAYAALLVWFFGAPNWRFGYGTVLGLAAFTISVALAEAGARLSDRARGVIATAVPVALCAFLAVTHLAALDASDLQHRILLPMDYYPSAAIDCELEGLPFYCASIDKQCGYSAFPCVPGLPRSVRARGPSLQDGFYSTELEPQAP